MRWPTRSVQTIVHLCDKFEIGFGAILQFSLLPQLAKDQALDPPNPKEETPKKPVSWCCQKLPVRQRNFKAVTILPLVHVLRGEVHRISLID